MRRLIILLLIVGCDNSTESKKVYGCTDSTACNFNATATSFDDSCINELDCWGECGTAIIWDRSILHSSDNFLDSKVSSKTRLSIFFNRK